jgi:phytoene synthase
MDYRTAIQACRALHRTHGKRYYFATRFFPRDLREATFALYAFFRVPDEIVDGAGTTPGEAARRLEAFRRSWHESYERRRSDDPVLFAAQDVFHRYNIPPAYADVFLDAMAKDTVTSRYATYADLETYMYGSAAVVGLMMTRVIGTNGATWEEVETPARKLGEAMQLTNFLRDIREDLEVRGRIYLPQDELRRAGITERSIAAHTVDGAWRSFMQGQVARADALYTEAESGVHLLDRRGRFPVRLAARLYRHILRQIERLGYDVFSSRAKTTTLEKLWITITSI